VPNIDKSSDFQKAIAAGQMIALCAMSERSLQLFMDWLAMHYPDFPAADIRVFVPSPALVATANKLGLNASAPPEISRLALLEHIRNWAEAGQS
jgi:uroporphyrinogen-III synthase